MIESALTNDDFTPNLEFEFQAACDAAIDEWRVLGFPPSGHPPTIWINMSNKLGAATAARRLLISGDIQDGFERLVKIGRPDLTVEWAVLQPRWNRLFREDIRDAARWRLKQAGAVLPE